jgi:hypothetical protein
LDASPDVTLAGDTNIAGATNLGSSLTAAPGTTGGGGDTILPAGGSVTGLGGNNDTITGATAGIQPAGGSPAPVASPTGSGAIPTGQGLLLQEDISPQEAAAASALQNPPSGLASASATGQSGGLFSGSSGGLGLGSPAQGANAEGIAGAINGFLGTNLSAGNLATLGLGAGALGYIGLKGAETPKGLNAISGEATNLNNQATQLESYLQTGTLPPGVQTSLNQAAAAAQATIRSQYAARGMSGSSAEAQDLANVQNTIASQGASIAQSLLTTGVQESGLAAQLYEQILNQSLQSDQQLGTALTTLASSTARPTIQIGGTTSG